MLQAKITNRLWMGNEIAANNNDFLQKNNICFIISLGAIIQDESARNVFNFTIPPHELMDNEIPKRVIKLNTVLHTLFRMLNANGNILVTCPTGKDVAPLVVAYYMTQYSKGAVDTAILLQQIEYSYFTNDQKDRYATLDKLFSSADRTLSSIDLTDRYQLQNLKCLKNKSFQKIIKQTALNARAAPT